MSHRELSTLHRIGKDERPNVDPDAVHHRQLMQPGPAMIEFDLRNSHAQELISDLPKRKSGTAALKSPFGSISPSQQITDKQKAKPVKDLKIVQHVFSNGDSVQGQRGGIRTSYQNTDATAVRERPRSVQERGTLPASPGHLMYKETRSGKWRTTKRLSRKHNPRADSTGRSELQEIGPGKSPNQLVGRDGTNSPSDDAATAAAVDKEKENGPSSMAVPFHDCSGRICDYVSCHKRAFRNPNSTANTLALSEDLSENGRNTQYRHMVPDHSITRHDNNNNSNQPSPTHHTASGRIASAISSRMISPMSAREMAGNGFEDCLPEAHPDDQLSEKYPLQADSNDNDNAHLITSDRTMSRSVSPIAHGKVWETKATRRERRRHEKAAAANNPSTTSLSMPDSSIDPNLATPSAPANDRVSPAAVEIPKYIDAATATDSASTIPNGQPTRSSVPIGPTSHPLRPKQQDTNCLICLEPVTAAGLSLAHLRCSACPRVFHGPCLTYHTPSANQHWRCSLCYKESWPGYGHLPAERDYKNPSLVERYRRRLLLATTYEIPGNPEASRFWFDMDLDGDYRSDQAALVNMRVVNRSKLRSVGEMRAQSIIQMERWAIDLGMALQQEEWKNEWLMADNEKLKALLAEKEADIAELEGGL